MDSQKFQQLMDTKDYNDFFDILHTELDLSTLMMDTHRPIEFEKRSSFGSRKFMVSKFIKFQSIVEALGWKEHTSDWDLYLKIETYGDGTLETIPGYADSEIIEEGYLLIPGPDPELDNGDYSEFASPFWDNNHNDWRIPLGFIKSIQLCS